MTSTWPFWSQSRYFNGKRIFSLRMVSGEKRDAVRIVLVHVLQQISRSPSPVPCLFTVPHTVFSMDEKRASCASRLAADLPPEAHLYEAVFVSFCRWDICLLEKSSGCILKKGGSSLSLSVHILGWPLMCSVDMICLSQGWSLPIGTDVRMGRQTGHAALGQLRWSCGNVWCIKSPDSWPNRTRSPSCVTNLLYKHGEATCSFWDSLSTSLKLGAEQGYLLALFHVVFIFSFVFIWFTF